VQVRERLPGEGVHDQPFEKRPHPPRVEELDVHEWRENVVARQRLAVYVEAQRQPPSRVSSRVPVADSCPGVQVDAGWKVGHFVGDRAWRKFATEWVHTGVTLTKREPKHHASHQLDAPPDENES
jgi:hypothetical protein